MVWRSTGVKASELGEATPVGVTVAGSPFVLVRLGRELHAVDGVCPHLGAELAEGTVDRGELTCPLHGAVFDLATGAVRADPFGLVPPEGGVGPLGSHAVRVTDGTVEVDVPVP